MPEPWERQTGEPRVAHAAFCVYRDLGPARSLAKVVKATGRHSTTIHRYSAKWAWVSRTDAWDAEQDRLARAAAADEIKDMHRRHAQLAVTILNRVASRLLGGTVSAGGEQMVVAPIDPNRLDADDIARLMTVAVKIERVARGDTETRITVDSSSGDEADYEAARRLMGDEALLAQAEQLAAELFEDQPKERRLRSVS